MFSSLLKWNDVTLSKILCIAFLEFWKHDPYLPGLCESGKWLGYRRKSNPIMLTDLDWVETPVQWWAKECLVSPETWVNQYLEVIWYYFCSGCVWLLLGRDTRDTLRISHNPGQLLYSSLSSTWHLQIEGYHYHRTKGPCSHIVHLLIGTQSHP